MRRRIKQLGPISISLIALFVVLGGSAAATTGFIITSTDQIAPGVLSQLKGPRGPRGPRGARGPAGPRTTSNSASTALGGSQGPVGPAGPQGPQGTRGPQGKQGQQGAKGPKGATGAKGATGPTGPPGITGMSVSQIVVKDTGPLPLPAGGFGGGQASCPAGYVLINGGWSSSGRDFVVTAEGETQVPTGQTPVQAESLNLQNNANVAITFDVWADCYPALP